MADIKAFYCYHDNFPVVQALSDEEAGQLYKAKFRYSISGELPDFHNERLAMAWLYEKIRMDNDRKSYYIRCVRNSYNAYRRDTEKSEQMSIEVWFTWKKAVLRREGTTDPAFEMLEPSDLRER